MLHRVSILLIASIFSVTIIKAQSKIELRKKAMIAFLIEKQDLSNIGDWRAQSNYMFERTIFNKKVRNMKYEILIFGATSSHAKKYICLVNQNSHQILQTDNLDDDISTILKFIKESSNDLPAKTILDLLDEIVLCYSNNKKSFINKVEIN